ncbi:MAG: SRPBCC family protein [Chitinophagales bacterium]|jgi:ligand-binding SRPBCC domain-containing protein|nr:SRPBCC family protein [Sphingobacteriales bacterium]
MAAIYQFRTTQKIPASLDKVWEFISSPRNLKKITPEHLGFQITNEPIADKMYAGMIIAYKVSPILGIPMDWVTEITHVEEKVYFVDEQRIGPYAIWHHQHRLTPIEGGVLMEDIISYKPPFGILGTIANNILIKGQLKTIFDFRFTALEKEFGKWIGL